MKQGVFAFDAFEYPRLDDFIVQGETGLMTHLRGAIQAIQQTQHHLPTYFWGACGSGKSHLLQACYYRLREQGLQVGYMDANTHQEMLFQNQWSAIFLDDVHLYNAEQQAWAFNAFIHAHSTQRWIVATGECAPAQLSIREDLRTRLAWGYLFTIKPIDEQGMRLALMQVAKRRQFEFGHEVLDFILKHFQRDMSSLMGLLNHMDAYSLSSKRAITVPMIKEMLAQLE